MKIRHLIFLLPFILLLNSSCQEEEINIAQEQTVDIDDPVVQHILSLGFAAEDIVENNDVFIVENDIVFPKSMNLLPNGVKPEHYRSANIVSPSYRNISVYIDLNSFDLNSEDNYQGAINIKPILATSLNQAINAYNSLNTSVQFSVAPYPFGADITIRKVQAYWQGGACGAAGFPSIAGKPYSQIEIFPLSVNGTVSKLTETIVHELGHCIGIRHTDIHNDPAASLIPGTPSFDSGSVMNSYGCGNSWNGFSAGDIDAIECLYSNNQNTLCTSNQCTTPSAPFSINITTDNQNYLYAQALVGRSLKGLPDGYEWDVVGGYFNGGFGTDKVSIVPYCDYPGLAPGTIQLAVRTYNQSGSTKCYSNWITTTYVYSGRCYLIFN